MTEHLIAANDHSIFLGHSGENLATQIIFDVCQTLEEFGEDGTFILLHQRPWDKASYPVEITLSGHKVLWNVTSADTAQATTARKGCAQLQYLQGEQVVKSQLWSTIVEPAIGKAGDAPDPEKGWVQEFLETVAEMIEEGSATDERIAAAVAAYFEEHPIEGITADECAEMIAEALADYIKTEDLEEIIATVISPITEEEIDTICTE